MDYKFKNQALLEEALTHKSYANDENTKSYERLEFLGDSLLSIFISEYLFNIEPLLPEGELTRIRAAIVCESSLAECAKKLGLGEMIKFNRGEEMTGGRERTSIIADVVEAVIAAIYIDGGFEQAREFTIKNLEETIKNALSGKSYRDHKTALQEKVQGSTQAVIEYRLNSQEGPDHNKTFTTDVLIGGKVAGTGSGRTKKEAEQMAARAALNSLL